MNSDNNPIKKPATPAPGQPKAPRKQPTPAPNNDDELVVLSATPAPAPHAKPRKDLWLNNDEKTQLSQKPHTSSPNSPMPKAKKSKKKDNRNFFQRNIILFNILIMVCVGLILCWLSYLMLDVWTGHGDERTVPNVIGKKLEAGKTLLNNNDLKVIISDSVFDNPAAPGTIIDQNPHEGARVKNGRAIYVTIVAFSPKLIVVPNLETSGQQAIERFRAMGVNNLDTVMVIAEDRVGLVLGATYNGHQLHKGDKIPVNAHVTLTIGMKRPEPVYIPEENEDEDNNSNTADDADVDAALLKEAIKQAMKPGF